MHSTLQGHTLHCKALLYIALHWFTLLYIVYATPYVVMLHNMRGIHGIHDTHEIHYTLDTADITYITYIA